MPLEMIPPELKKAQWQEFLKASNRLSRMRPVALELRLLHHIFSSGAKYKLLEEQKEEAVQLMHFTDNPNGCSSAIERILSQPEKRPLRRIMDYMEEHTKSCARVEVEFAPTIRGGLRTFGRRRIDRGDWEHVYASPAFTFEASASFRNGLDQPIYYPPSLELHKIWEALCRKYNALMDSSQDFEHRLLSESFLQLIGTRALHPFIDANGRTFAAHLVLILSREKMEMHSHRQFLSLMGSMSSFHYEFVKNLLQGVGMGFIRGERSWRVLLDPAFRRDYMGRLNSALMDAIEAGIEPGKPYYSTICGLGDRIMDQIVNHPDLFTPGLNTHL